MPYEPTNIKVKIDNTQQNSKFGFGGEKDEAINCKKIKWRNLVQNE